MLHYNFNIIIHAKFFTIVLRVKQCNGDPESLTVQKTAGTIREPLAPKKAMHPRSLHPLAAHGTHEVRIWSADRYWNIPALDGNSAVCLIIFLERWSTASDQMRVIVCGDIYIYIYEPTGNGGKCITRGLTICTSVLLPLIVCLMPGKRGCAETDK